MKATKSVTKAGKAASAKEKAIKNIRVMHHYCSKTYQGSKADIVASGLAKAEQCPTEQGDEYTIAYKLDGKEVTCSHQNCGHGPEYWVSVDDPQPNTCKSILKALGDPTALDEIVSKNTGRIFALQDFVENYEKLPIDGTTIPYLVRPLFEKLAREIAKGRTLFSKSAEYQTHIAQAAKCLERLIVIIDEIDCDTSSEDVGVLLRVYMRSLGDSVAAAAQTANVRGGGDWGEAERATKDWQLHSAKHRPAEMLAATAS